jgi:hypothetical protein
MASGALGEPGLLVERADAKSASRLAVSPTTVTGKDEDEEEGAEETAGATSAGEDPEEAANTAAGRASGRGEGSAGDAVVAGGDEGKVEDEDEAEAEGSDTS